MENPTTEHRLVLLIVKRIAPDYYYISYRSVEDFQEGDTILTYFIYNPDTNYTDDILERFDYVIDREVDNWWKKSLMIFWKQQTTTTWKK